MAKDKGTKPDKSKAAKGGKPSKGADEFGKPSEAKGGGDGWTFADPDNIGELFLFTPLREDVTTVTRGKKTEEVKIIVADVVHINEKKPPKSELHEEVFIFPKWVQGSLRSYIGDRRVIGRLARDAAKSQGDRAAWVLEDADDDDIATVRQYLATVDPFEQSGKDKAKGKSKNKGK